MTDTLSQGSASGGVQRANAQSGFTGVTSGREPSRGVVTGRRMNKPTRVTKQFEILKLQQAVQQMAQQFQSTANATRAAHELTMTTIKNIRA